MTSIRFLLRTGIVALAIVAGSNLASGAIEKKNDADRAQLFQERTYLGKPFSYWLKMIRDRNKETIGQAFDAIRSLGPDAWIAVPDLTRLVAAPFDPIEIEKDSHESIAAKLYDIVVRAEAIDTLAWIGESGSPATLPLIRWALAERIVTTAIRNPENDELFMEVVIMDTEQRMRVAGAVAQFGPDAAPIIAGLLRSTDAAMRKLGVAILNQGALPIAGELMRSHDCEDRKLGLLILRDMELVVARPYLDELQDRVACIRVANRVGVD